MGFSAGSGLDGMNLADVVAGRSDKGRSSLVMMNVPFIDKKPRPNRPAVKKGEERCVVQGEWKLILSTVRVPELYHLPTNPTETNNRWGTSMTKAIEPLNQALKVWAKRTADPLSQSLAVSSGPTK